ncbi:MAG: hypothetical protein PHC44_03450 [Lutispora sp.]|nr:hypothetical protein [Lutispora sp.]MDD4833771.1 hypothetical protein [Lutispora sp.]
MFRFNVNKKFGPVFVTIIAIMLILYGLIHISLGIVGEKDTAIITNIRRQGGERNESVPNRYTYVVSYSFTLPNGKKVDGFTYKIGSAVYVKISDSNISMAPVKYLNALPQMNALESETGFKMGNIIIIGTGIVIIKLIKPKSKSKKRF